MADSKHDTHSKDVETFFHGYAKDFSSIYEEDERPRSAFNLLMDKLFRQDIKDRFNETIKEVKMENGSKIISIDSRWPILSAIIALNKADFFLSKSAADTARGQPIAGLKP